MTKIQKIKLSTDLVTLTTSLVFRVNELVDASNSQEERLDRIEEGFKEELELNRKHIKSCEERLSKVEEPCTCTGRNGYGTYYRCPKHNLFKPVPQQEKRNILTDISKEDADLLIKENTVIEVPQEKPEIDVRALILEYRTQSTSYERMIEIETILTNALQGR